MSYPRIRKGHDFADAEVVTPDDLDELVDSAMLELSGPRKVPTRTTAGAGAADAEADLDDLTGTKHRPKHLQIDGLDAVAYAGSVALDFDAGTDLKQITLGGNVSFTTSNRAAGKSAVIVIVGDGSLRTLTFPSGGSAWRWVTDKPTQLAAGKIGTLALMCRDGNETGIIAAYSVEA